MPIQVDCPSCRTAFRVEDDYAGKRGTCPHCNEKLVVPSAVGEGVVATDAPRPVGNDGAASEAYELAGAGPKPRAVPVRPSATAPGSGVFAEGVAKAVEPSGPTRAPSEILAAFHGEIAPVRPTPLYRLWILVVAAVMVLLPMVYVAIIGLVVLLVGLHAVNNVGIFQSVRNAKGALALYLGPIVAGGVVIAFMLKPLFARPAKREKARALDPSAEPVLFAFVDSICTSVGSPRPSRIEVNCEVNASAHREGGPLAVLNNRLVLTIGMPLAAGLNLKQFAGVLAHEFGHFSQGVGMRLSYLIRSINFWFARVVYQRDEWDETLAAWSTDGNVYSMLLAGIARLAVWLTRRVLWVLMYLGHLVSSFLLRQMEYDADRYEARMVGGEVFASTCWRLRELNLAEGGAFADLRASWQERRLPDNLPRLILANVPQIPAPALAAYRQTMDEQKTGLFDTHPADKDRIARALAEPSDKIFSLDGPATDLFGDFDSLARDATFDRYRGLLGPEIRKEQLFAVADLVQSQAVTLEGHEAFDRYFLGGFGPTRGLPLACDYPEPPADLDAARQALVEARSDLEAARGDDLAASKPWGERHERSIVAQTGLTLLKAGNSFKPADFGLTAATPGAAEAARDEALADLRRIDQRCEPFESAAARRLTLALSLLEADSVAAQIPDGPARRDEAHALYPCAAHLGGRLAAEMPAVHRDQQTLLRLVNAYQQGNNQKNQPLINAVLRAAEQLHERLEEFRTKVGDTLNYPFEHAQETITLAWFALPQVPEKNNVGELLQAGDEALGRLSTLYRRTLGRLAVTAEEVERALGLPPIEVAKPEGSDGRSVK
jgi:Zn-dependent protease with chaperone function